MKKEENKDKVDEENKEPPLKRTRRNSIIEKTYQESDDEDIQPLKNIITENDTEDTPKKTPVCPGCFPIFQENQLGHYGPNGCLGDEFTLDDSSK